MNLNILTSEEGTIRERLNNLWKIGNKINKAKQALDKDNETIEGIIETWQKAEDDITILKKDINEYCRQLDLYWPTTIDLINKITQIAIVEACLAEYIIKKDIKYHFDNDILRKREKLKQEGALKQWKK